MSTYYGLDTVIGAEDELYSPWNSPGQRTGVGSQFPSPGDLPHPRIQPRFPALQADSFLAEHQESPILEWVAYPFSSGSSQPRNRTGVPCIAGRFLASCSFIYSSINGNM